MQLPLSRLSFLILIYIVGINVAAAQERMRIAIPLFPTAAFPLLVASDRGFFQREGLTVEPIRINSAPTTYHALISGDVHGAVGAPTGLLPSYAQGADTLRSAAGITSYLMYGSPEKGSTMSASSAANGSASIAPAVNLGL